MLAPETPTQLSEGDTITFGKSVGSNADLVRPIVARIELRYRRVDGFKPLTTPTNTVIRLDLTKGSPKSSSGRYGLYDSSSSSSDDSSSVMSDNDSDIEEIPASGANAVSLLSRSSHGTDKGSNLSRAFTAFKRLVSPVSPVRRSQRLRSRDLQEARNPMTFAHPYSLPPLDMSDECYLDSPIYSPYNLRSLSPMFNIPDSDVLPSSERSTSPVLNAVPPYNLRSSKNKVRVGSESGSDARSRSSSPMDLASSPPFSHCPSPAPEQANEPSIIGAYPKSRCSSPSEPSKAKPVEGVNEEDKAEVIAEGNVARAFEDSEEEEDAEAEADDAEAETDDDEDSEAETPEADAQHAESRSSPKPSPIPQTSKAPTPDHGKEDAASVTSDQGMLASDVSKLRIGLTELQVYLQCSSQRYSSLQLGQGEVEKLQIHRRKYKERFNTNVDKLSDKLSKMDKRIADVNAQYNVLCDQVADAMDVDIPELQNHVEALQNQMDVLAPALDMTSEPPMHKREDVKTSIEALHDLVAGKSGWWQQTPRPSS